MRTTITLNDAVFHSLKVYAAESGMTISKLIEEAVVCQLLEDAEDLEDAKARAGETPLLFADLVAQFKAEGLL